VTITLRPYQQDVVNEVRKSFAEGYKCPLLVAATGAGKTVMFSYIAKNAADKNNAILIAAHRKEIIRQISLSLARFALPHNVIAAPALVRAIKIAQFKAFGKSFVDTTSSTMVGSVQTIVGRFDSIDAAIARLSKRIAKPAKAIVIQDEGHHVVQNTAWGHVMDRYGPAVGNVSLIVTASPQRLDGRGLGKGHGGYADTIIEAPPMSWLIENGFLSPYRVFTAQHQIDVSSVKTRMGDYAASELQEVVDKPQITGDAITHWRKHANGLKTAIFCVSVEHSKHVAAEFNANGIPAAHIDGGTDDAERDKAIIDFANGKILVITNVNILSEGFDLASIAQQDVTIDCVVDLAPTQSLVNALQRWGRALRPAPNKTAILLDHAGNVMRHGLPDEDRAWTLEGVKKKKRKTEEDDEDDVKVKCCPECFSIHAPDPVCPNCGHVYEIKARKIEHIEGELKEIQQAQIEQMRRTRMLQQGKAQTVEDLMAQGMSRGRAEKIIEARLAKQALQEEIFNKLSDIQVKTGFGPYQTCGFTRADILRMKPKELKALSATITTVNNLESV
jgi:superfamily II DNA or RNA helicase